MPAPARRPVGRPSLYAPDLAAVISDRMAEGETLSAICRDDDMPSRMTVFRWERAHEGLRDALACTREAQALRWADELPEIADDGTNDFMERRRQDGSTEMVFNAEHVQRSKLRVDTRKWLLAKALPRLYGDRPACESGTPTNPIVVLLRQMQARALPVVPSRIVEAEGDD